MISVTKLHYWISVLDMRAETASTDSRYWDGQMYRVSGITDTIARVPLVTRSKSVIVRVTSLDLNRNFHVE